MLSEQIKEYRKKHKITQSEFAKLIGISRTYLSDLENGRAKGNLKVLLKLSSNTNTSLKDWIDEENDEKSIEDNYNLYSVLDTFIENLISLDGINKETGKISEEYIPSIINILEAEIKLKLQKREEY